MKKTITFILAVLFACSLFSACSGDVGTQTGTQSGSSSGSGGGQSGSSTGQSGASAPDEIYTISFGITNSITNEEDPEIVFCLRFADYIDEKSNGALQMEFHPNLQLGSMEEMRDMVMSGTLGGILANVNVLSSVYPDTMALVCPGLFAEEAEVNAILRGEWGNDFFLKMAEETNLFPFAVCSNGMRCYTSSKSPLTTVDSISGQTIRVMQSPLCVKMAESIGINAVPMAGSEMYSAMANGTVDGQENGINAIINDKTYEVQKYLVLDQHMPSIDVMLMDYALLKSLPEEYQQIIRDGGLYASELMAEAIDRVNVEGIKFLEDQGMKVYTPTAEERDAWQQPVFDACYSFLANEIGTDVLDQVSKLIHEHRG